MNVDIITSYSTKIYDYSDELITFPYELNNFYPIYFDKTQSDRNLCTVHLYN